MCAYPARIAARKANKCWHGRFHQSERVHVAWLPLLPLAMPSDEWGQTLQSSGVCSTMSGSWGQKIRRTCLLHLPQSRTSAMSHTPFLYRGFPELHHSVPWLSRTSSLGRTLKGETSYALSNRREEPGYRK